MKKYLIVLIILSHTCCYIKSADAQSLEDSLVVHYPFNGNTNDKSGNGNNGILNGAILTIDKFGDENCAYYFDGVDDYIQLPSDFDLPVKTLNIWFNAHIISTTLGCIYNSDHPNLNYGKTGLSVQESYGVKKLAFERGISGPSELRPIDENQWYMATIAINGSSSKYYLNGKLIETKLGFGKSVNGNINATLGTTRSFNRYFNGKIDDVRIYNRILSKMEIEELYYEKTSPSILTNPQSKTICIGQNSVLIVSAVGALPITYQWQKDGIDLINVTDTICIIADAQTSDAGDYKCIATNSYGDDTSDVAAIIVQTISQSSIMGPTTVSEWQTATYSVTSQTGHTYNFSLTGGNEISNTTNSIKVQWGTNGWGHIKLVETNFTGCVADTVDLKVAVGNVGIDDITIREKVSFVPNPVSNYLYFNKKQSINIYTLEGKSLLSDYTDKINVSGLTNGLYILRINNNYEKFIKQ